VSVIVGAVVSTFTEVLTVVAAVGPQLGVTVAVSWCTPGVLKRTSSGKECELSEGAKVYVEGARSTVGSVAGVQVTTPAVSTAFWKASAVATVSDCQL
jgi:hypothetical protein